MRYAPQSKKPSSYVYKLYEIVEAAGGKAHISEIYDMWPTVSDETVTKSRLKHLLHSSAVNHGYMVYDSDGYYSLAPLERYTRIKKQRAKYNVRYRRKLNKSVSNKSVNNTTPSTAKVVSNEPIPFRAKNQAAIDIDTRLKAVRESTKTLNLARDVENSMARMEDRKAFRKEINDSMNSIMVYSISAAVLSAIAAAALVALVLQ